MTSTDMVYGRMQEEVTALATSINEIVCKFRALHNPLAESQERVPQATEQLDKISQQTEAAAHQMLDRVEGITQREGEVMDGLRALRAQCENRGMHDAERLIDTLLQKVDTNSNEAFLIMDALQFQDITAQQMNHAAALLEDIETRLRSIVAVIQGREPQENGTGKPRARRVYDPHADLGDKRTVQEDIDNLFARKK